MSNTETNELIIDGIHMHSSINPEKEALFFCERYDNEIQNNTSFLVFGVGAGYHLKALVKKLQDLNKSIDIIVLDPKDDLIDSFLEKNIDFSKTKGLRFVSESIENIYSHQGFCEFLIKKPSILIHQPSFQISKDFYQRFLKYRPSKNLVSHKNNIDNELVEHFNSLKFDEYIDIKSYESKNQKEYNIESVIMTLLQRI